MLITHCAGYSTEPAFSGSRGASSAPSSNISGWFSPFSSFMESPLGGQFSRSGSSGSTSGQSSTSASLGAEFSAWLWRCAPLRLENSLSKSSACSSSSSISFLPSFSGASSPLTSSWSWLFWSGDSSSFRSFSSAMPPAFSSGCSAFCCSGIFLSLERHEISCLLQSTFFFRQIRCRCRGSSPTLRPRKKPASGMSSSSLTRDLTKWQGLLVLGGGAGAMTTFSWALHLWQQHSLRQAKQRGVLRLGKASCSRRVRRGAAFSGKCLAMHMKQQIFLQAEQVIDFSVRTIFSQMWQGFIFNQFLQGTIKKRGKKQI